ncbi:hypothetical protein BU16DRAFT_561757 [Lophium mytilinum]|uniref:Uncharacterized protein n=1 Tax=Lophium mytilinum TaxID=390894 RepID=A0A6A6QSS9_9PEZI|nr:hypothetical protein BU16DRAFT_561757 [Lophium mytilinum]
MPPTTLTSLPAELRQQILADTITIKISERDGFNLSTPAAGVCKLFLADVEEIRRSWLPPPSTPTIIQNPSGVDGLVLLDAFYKERAEDTKREWPGINSIRIYVFSTETTSWPPRPSYDKTVRNPLRPYGLFNLRWTWVDEANFRLPSSIQHVVVDMNLPAAQVQRIEEAGPDGPHVPKGRKNPYFKFQREYWSEALPQMQSLVHSIVAAVIPSRNYERSDVKWLPEKETLAIVANGVTFEMVGELPQSQAQVVAAWLIFKDEYSSHGQEYSTTMCNDAVFDRYLSTVKQSYCDIAEEKRGRRKATAKRSRERRKERENEQKRKREEYGKDAAAGAKRARMEEL